MTWAQIDQAMQGLDALDYKLLRWLCAYPWSGAEDMANAAGVHRATIYRRLEVLRKGKLVEIVTPASLGAASCTLYALSNTGVLALASFLQVDPRRLQRLYGSDDARVHRLLPRLDALMTVQHLVTDAMAAAPDVLTVQGHRSTIRWWWQRDIHERYSYRGRAMSVGCDALVVLRVQTILPEQESLERWYAFFVLLDTGLLDTRGMQMRLRQMMSYRERAGAEQWLHYQHFPAFLLLTSSPRRESCWLSQAQKVAFLMRGVPLIGGVAQLDACAHSLWQAPWKAWDGTRCHLHDLLPSLPVESLSRIKHIWFASDDLAPEGSGSLAVLPMISGGWSRPKRVPRLLHRLEAVEEQAHVRSRRDLDLLTLLCLHPALSSAELALLTEVQLPRLMVRLTDLAAWLEPVLPQTALIRQRWRLNEEGLRLVARVHRVPLATARRLHQPPQATDASPKPPTHLTHLAGVYGFFAQIAAHCTTSEASQFLWWETGGVCARAYTSLRKRHLFLPDALAEIQVDHTRQIRFWLEYDRGTMNARDLEAKWAMYARYLSSRSWRAEHQILPRLLVVVPDQAQEARIRRTAEEVLKDSLVALYTTTQMRLERAGPLASIWLPWRAHQPEQTERCSFLSSRRTHQHEDEHSTHAQRGPPLPIQRKQSNE